MTHPPLYQRKILLLNENLLAIYNVDTGLGNLVELAAVEVVDTLECRVHLLFNILNTCVIGYVEQDIDNLSAIVRECTAEVAVAVTCRVNAAPILLDAQAIDTRLCRNHE